MKVRTLMMNRKTIAGLMLIGFVAMGLGSLSAVSQAENKGRTMNTMEMGEMMGNRNGDYGMGRSMGMMGRMMGMGSGTGMMGGQGMMGMGMMGRGMGMDMMGSGGMMGGTGMTSLPMLDLTEQQRTRINKIQHSLRKKNWSTMGKIMDAQDNIRDLYTAEKRDPKEIGAVYDKILNLKRQMIEAAITANNQQKTVLTKEQREQLKQLRRGTYKDAGPRGRNHHGDMPGGMMGR